MKSNTLLLLLAAGAVYYLYRQSNPALAMLTCKYPDGTLIQIPPGNACPYDMRHGGQSQLTYPQNVGVQQGPCATGYMLAADGSGNLTCVPLGSIS